jgi:hypothetical protein
MTECGDLMRELSKRPEECPYCPTDPFCHFGWQEDGTWRELRIDENNCEVAVYTDPVVVGQEMCPPRTAPITIEGLVSVRGATAPWENENHECPPLIPFDDYKAAYDQCRDEVDRCWKLVAWADEHPEKFFAERWSKDGVLPDPDGSMMRRCEDLVGWHGPGEAISHSEDP